MFKKLWLALANLVNSIQNLADTFHEADTKARVKFGLKERAQETPELEHKSAPKIAAKEKVSK